MGTVGDLGLLMLRVGVGASCFSHGAQQPFGWFGGGGTGPTVESAMGFEPGERNARTAGVLETAGGTLLALGLATGPVGAALTGNMMVASSPHAPNGLVGSTFALTGPGRFSIDYLTRVTLNRPWMRALALVGALATAAYVVSSRSAIIPEDDEDDED